jgi:hypothetical protein
VTRRDPAAITHHICPYCRQKLKLTRDGIIPYHNHETHPERCPGSNGYGDPVKVEMPVPPTQGRCSSCGRDSSVTRHGLIRTHGSPQCVGSGLPAGYKP